MKRLSSKFRVSWLIYFFRLVDAVDVLLMLLLFLLMLLLFYDLFVLIIAAGMRNLCFYDLTLSETGGRLFIMLVACVYAKLFCLCKFCSLRKVRELCPYQI